MGKLKAKASELKRQIRISRLLLSDKRTPIKAKIFIYSAIFYLLLPIDIIPDFIPVIGQLDDLLIVPFLLGLAYKSIPKNLIKEYEAKSSARAGRKSNLSNRNKG